MLEPQALTGKHAMPQFYNTWTKKIAEAQGREKNYRRLGKKVVDLYEAREEEASPYSIVYSNTEVLAPSVYNARPVPMVLRRYRDADPIGKAVAETSTRLLKYLVDVESANYDSFDELMQAAVLDGLLTNRGLTRYKFVATDNGLPECVYGEAVRWDKFFHGYSRTWKKVPWIGFEWDMSEAEVKKNFKDITFESTSFKTNDDEDDATSSEKRSELLGVKTFRVYEVWDKLTGKVYFFSPCWPKGALRVVDDPLSLSGFYPIPKPLNFTRKSSTLIPTPLYEHYKAMAQELNDVTRRLRAIIKAIKYRGAYNAAIEGIEKMLEADDNELVPVTNMQSMPDNMGMDKMLYIVPINELAQTAQSLYQQREQVKSVIYEITGISDILRGASVASETATAQQIKNQWGTLRLKKMQKEVQRYCRESLAIMLEIATSSFEPQTVQQMTGLPFLFEEQANQMKGQIAQTQQAAQQAQAMAQQQAQATGQPPPQIPPPPPVPPEIEEALKQPTWEMIFEVLKNDVSLHYKCDIETNSTLDAEAAQDKQDISELLNALSQWLNGLAPLVEKGFLPFNLARDMLLTISRRFNFGSQLEDSLLSMEEPKSQADPAAAADAEMKKADMEMKKAEVEAKLATLKATAEAGQAKAQMELQVEQAELEMKKAELELQRETIMMKLEFAREQHQMKLQSLAAKAASDKASAENKESSNA